MTGCVPFLDTPYTVMCFPTFSSFYLHIISTYIIKKSIYFSNGLPLLLIICYLDALIFLYGLDTYLYILTFEYCCVKTSIISTRCGHRDYCAPRQWLIEELMIFITITYPHRLHVVDPHQTSQNTFYHYNLLSCPKCIWTFSLAIL